MIDDDKSPPTEGESKESAEGASACFWRRPRTRTMLLCAGFLIIGLGLGSLATSLAIHRAVRHGLRDPDRIASRVLSRMRCDLDLTDEQAAKILPILRERFAGLRDAIHREHEAKKDVQVFDYADVGVPVLAASFRRRLRTYRSMGYAITSSSD